MNLFIIRHAAAASKSTWTDGDGLRPLTKSGRARFSTAAAALVAAGALTPDLVLTSPLVRARETAEIAVTELGGKVPLVEDARLAGDFDLDDLRVILGEHGDVESLAIVGHNPSFTDVLAQLIGGADIEMRKGAVALVIVEDASTPAGRLAWLAPTAIFGSGD